MSSGKVHTSDPTRPFKQDLPPKEGYAPISFKRIPARQLVNAKILFGGFLIWQGIGYYSYYLGSRQFRRERIEMTSATLALRPMLTAERDREYLKQLRRNREYEADLMKDVPGWEVGTWFGQPIYRTVEEWMDPNITEFYSFARPIHTRRELNYKEAMVG